MASDSSFVTKREYLASLLSLATICRQLVETFKESSELSAMLDEIASMATVERDRRQKAGEEGPG